MTVSQYGDRTLILGLLRQGSEPLRNGTIVFMNQQQQQQTNQLPVSCPLANTYAVALQPNTVNSTGFTHVKPCFVVKRSQSVKMRNM